MAKVTQPLNFDSNIELIKQFYEISSTNFNSFKQKIRVLKLNRSEGKIKVNKEGQPVTNEFGEVEKWDDRFYVTFQSLSGGSDHSVAIDQQMFEYLQEGKIYIIEGEISYKTFGDEFNSRVILLLKNATPEIDYLVATVKNLQNSIV